MDTTQRDLRLGFLGAGFIARFHLQSLTSVRRCRLAGVFSPSRESRETLAAEANALDLGPCAPYASIEELVDSGDVDVVYILGPNDARVDSVRRIVDCVKRQRKENGKSSIIGIACEKPLARTVVEAEEMLRLVEETGLLHGYLGGKHSVPRRRSIRTTKTPQFIVKRKSSLRTVDNPRKTAHLLSSGSGRSRR